MLAVMHSAEVRGNRGGEEGGAVGAIAALLWRAANSLSPEKAPSGVARIIPFDNRGALCLSPKRPGIFSCVLYCVSRGGEPKTFFENDALQSFCVMPNVCVCRMTHQSQRGWHGLPTLLMETTPPKCSLARCN